MRKRSWDSIRCVKQNFSILRVTKILVLYKIPSISFKTQVTRYLKARGCCSERKLIKFLPPRYGEFLLLTVSYCNMSLTQHYNKLIIRTISYLLWFNRGTGSEHSRDIAKLVKYRSLLEFASFVTGVLSLELCLWCKS